jgi:hypothetical protein
MILDILTGQGMNAPDFQNQRPHWPALILHILPTRSSSVPQASRQQARQRESEGGIYFHEGAGKDDRAISKRLCAKIGRFFASQAQAPRKKTIQTRQKVAETKSAYKWRERRSASGQPFKFLPTASAHVSAFTCADLITTRPPLVTTMYHSCLPPSATIAVVPQVVMTM